MKRYDPSARNTPDPRRPCRAMKIMPRWRRRPVFWGRHLATVPEGALVFFPLRPTQVNCGLAGLVAIKGPAPIENATAVDQLATLLDICQAHGFQSCQKMGAPLTDAYLGGHSPSSIA